MKNILIFIFMFTLFQGFSFSNSENGTETVKIKCEKMHCQGCKATITEALKSLDGVKKIDVNLKSKIITVTFDSNKTDKNKISEKILEAGYENEIMS